MSNDFKKIEQIYEKFLVREVHEDDVFSQNNEPKEHNPHAEEIAKTFNDDEHDPLNDDDDYRKPQESVKRLIATAQYLIQHYENVIDGAKTEKAFFRTLGDIVNELKSSINEIDIH